MTIAARTTPGWFGKLPGSGDFVHRRLGAPFLLRWDAWLRHELLAMRQRHPDWVASYLTAPVWRFTLAPGLLEVRGALGILMPSVDRVGRYFPLTLIHWFGDGAEPSALADAQRWAWWRSAGDAALRGLEADLGAAAFDELVQRVFSQPPAPGLDSGQPDPQAPAFGQSGWSPLDDGARSERGFRCAGLPSGSDFDVLFDLAGQPRAAEGMVS